MDNEELDVTKLKYVLYARKSTDDPERQIRSIPDQISECKQYALRHGLTIVDVLEETKSAKTPNLRPIFNKMVRCLKDGIYDAILAWNPDRLARNMLEGGMIIDMVDQDLIKDLKFVTHHFTKDANGKMLLGMAFVLSKQYSDNLSQNVTRGVRKRLTEEGKTPTPKHGYVNEDGAYLPDGKNFDLLCEAWRMRKSGSSLEAITSYMNSQGYQRIIKSSGRPVKMDKRILSQILHDSFYYGLLVQANQKVDLRELYGFTPAVSEDDYWAVQQLSYHRMKPSKPHTNAFYPLRMMVLCSFCNQPMRVGPSSGHSKKYLYYRCDTEGCARQTRSIRSKVVFDFIYKFLAGGLNFTEKEYHDYYDNLIQLTDEKRQKIRAELHHHQGLLKVSQTEIYERSLRIIKFDPESTVYKTNAKRIAELEVQSTQLTKKTTELEKQLRSPEEDQLTVEQFLNLSKKADIIVQSANAEIKDVICRKIFLNFCVDESKVASYQLKEPFATLIKQREQRTSRGDWT